MKKKRNVSSSPVSLVLIVDKLQGVRGRLRHTVAVTRSALAGVEDRWVWGWGPSELAKANTEGQSPSSVM